MYSFASVEWIKMRCHPFSACDASIVHPYKYDENVWVYASYWMTINCLHIITTVLNIQSVDWSLFNASTLQRRKRYHKWARSICKDDIEVFFFWKQCSVSNGYIWVTKMTSTSSHNVGFNVTCTRINASL